MTASPPSAEPPPPGLWQRMKLHILHPELSPRQVALSFALGLSIAWNPLIGTHTALALGLCLLFRHLHRPLLIAAIFINNPWTLVPMATASALLGNLALGRGLSVDLSGIHWHAIGWRSFLTQEGFQALRAMLAPILAPYLLGGAVLSLASVPVGYYAMLLLTRRLRRAAAHGHPRSPTLPVE